MKQKFILTLIIFALLNSPALSLCPNFTCAYCSNPSGNIKACTKCYKSQHKADAVKGDTCEGDPKVAGCLIEEASAICKACDTLNGYELLAVSNTKCFKCDYRTTYIAADGTCTTRLNSTENCSEINQLKDECNKCNPDYYLLNKACFKLPSFCAKLDDNKKCSQCNSAYFLSGENCIPIEVEACTEGSAVGVCTKCL